MGNAMVFPCFSASAASSDINLLFWDGQAMTLRGRRMAGEIMFQSPDMMVCHSDSFYVGQTLQALSIHDELLPGQTYFVLPIDRFAFKSITPSFLSQLSSSSSHRSGPVVNFAGDPSSPPAFQYSKAYNGRLQIKVSPEFITTLINNRNSTDNDAGGDGLCSTPELKKRYQQIVGSQVWSPKLETISEHNVRFSPCGFPGLEWKRKEKGGSR